MRAAPTPTGTRLCLPIGSDVWTRQRRSARSRRSAATYLRFDAPDGFAAEPGQFVKLGTEIDGESVARFYTLSSPTIDDTFEVTVGIDTDEGGEFSAFLADAEAGTEMTLSGPFGGDQHYDGEPRAVVIAGGPGVGPAVAIAGARARRRRRGCGRLPRRRRVARGSLWADWKRVAPRFTCSTRTTSLTTRSPRR